MNRRRMGEKGTENKKHNWRAQSGGEVGGG